MTEDIQDYGYVWTGYNLPDNLEIFVGDFTGIGQDEVVAVHPTGSIYIFRYDCEGGSLMSGDELPRL